MALSHAFDIEMKLPPVDMVQMFGGQEWLFLVTPLPQRGIKLTFTYPHSHTSSIWWSLSEPLHEPCLARVVILPTDGELVDASGWRIYADVNGTNPTTIFDRPKFPKRTGKFAIKNVHNEKPADSANLIEFYRQTETGDELTDFLRLTVQSE